MKKDNDQFCSLINEILYILWNISRFLFLISDF